jgi:putative salt-induced outer membrane protein
MKIKLALIIVFLIVLTGIAGAEDKSPWEREGELGVLVTTGNSTTESVNGKAKLNYEGVKWFNKTALGALYSAEETENDDGTKSKDKSAQKFLASDKGGYNLDELNYLFLLGSYEYDLLSGYYYQTLLSPGYGRRLIKTDRTKLDVEVGPGYRFSSVRETGDGDDDSEAVFRAAGMFSHKLTETTEFQQDLSVEIGSETTITKSVTALKAQIIGALAMKTSFTVKHNSDPPESDGDQAETTDTETAVTLVYSF